MTTIQALVNPGAFFKGMGLTEENLKVPALIVLAIGIIGAISSYFISTLTLQMMPAEAQALGSFIIAIGVVSAIVGAFIMWLIIAGIFYVLSMAFKGTGTFNRTLSFVGYGFLPQVIGGIISTVLIYSFVSTATIPTVTDPQMIADAILVMMKNPLLQISGIVGILFMLWSANIWVFALAYARNLSMRNALITVGVPVGLYALYALSTLF